MDDNELNKILKERNIGGVGFVRELLGFKHIDNIEGAILFVKEKINCSDDMAKEIIDNIYTRLDGGKDSPTPTQQEEMVHCPKCNSTQITAGARGWKLTTGFIGSNKTVNRCAACGYSWTPGK